MDIQSGRTRIWIDEQSGAITRIEDSVSGLMHVASSPDKYLFRLTVPAGIWTSRYADNNFSVPEVVKKTKSELCLRWPNLSAQDGEPSGVSVETLFSADANAGEIRFTLKISNNGSAPITDVHAPVIAGWTGLGGKGADWLVLGGHERQDPHRLPVNMGTTYAEIFQKSRAEYPVQLYAPWADLSGPGGGLSLVSYMEQPQNGTLFEYNTVGYGSGLRLAFGWRTPCVIQPGEAWESAAFGISVHGGDWHVTADRYVDWMNTWFTPPPGKRSLREMIGFQNVWLRGFDGTPFNRIGEIPRIAADGRRFGVDHLCIWDEPSMGAYERQDDRDILAYPPHEKDALQNALHQAREEGTNVNALVNFRLFPNRPAFTERYLQDASRLLDGSFRGEQYSASHNSFCGWTPDRGPNCFVASPFSQAYRERVLRWTREYLDLGYTSMFYDQPFETTADYGRIAAGCRPEDTYAAVCSLVAEVRQTLHAHNPDAYLIGEYCEAFMAQHIDLWMAWYRETHEALHAAYSIPQTMHSWVVDNDPAQASRAFAMGMYLCLCTRGNEATLAAVPEFGKHVLDLANLRRRTAERTVHARFRDNQGIDMKTGGTAVAYAFDSARGPAVIVAAPAAPSSITVTVDRERFTNPGTPESGQILRLNGFEQEVSGDTHSFELAANEVAVWIL